MDIAGLSVAMGESKVKDAVSLSLAKMAMNTGKEKANAMAEMIEKSCINPNVGQKFDAMA